MSILEYIINNWDTILLIISLAAVALGGPALGLKVHKTGRGIKEMLDVVNEVKQPNKDFLRTAKKRGLTEAEKIFEKLG